MSKRKEKLFTSIIMFLLVLSKLQSFIAFITKDFSIPRLCVLLTTPKRYTFNSGIPGEGRRCLFRLVDLSLGLCVVLPWKQNSQ